MKATLPPPDWRILSAPCLVPFSPDLPLNEEFSCLARGSHRDPSRRVVDEHLAHEVHPAGLQRDKNPLQGLRLPLGELVPVSQLAQARPHLLVGGAQQLEDVQQLLDLAVAWEQSSLHAHVG